ncbi:MAG TPA: ABC transporter permease, partial [Acidiferrobacteraceae bacterium]|nr:ABC transporter permease [Acidiferrobacteraceae bacterium]HEX19489.1 ABC transporter permease [Acidiferrobacteraceae bacterium]
MIFTIAGRELRNMFLSPLAWVILGITEMIFAILFMADVIEYLQQPRADGVTRFIVSPLFGWAAILLIFVIPLLTMRLISEERRNKTMALLFSAPITMTEIVLGKYLGIVMYLLIMVLAMLLLPMSLMFSSHLDFGMIATSVLGLTLLLCSIAAIGLFMSTLTQSPALAAIMAFGAVF